MYHLSQQQTPSMRLDYWLVAPQAYPLVQLQVSALPPPRFIRHVRLQLGSDHAYDGRCITHIALAVRPALKVRPWPTSPAESAHLPGHAVLSLHVERHQLPDPILQRFLDLALLSGILFRFPRLPAKRLGLLLSARVTPALDSSRIGPWAMGELAGARVGRFLLCSWLGHCEGYCSRGSCLSCGCCMIGGDDWIDSRSARRDLHGGCRSH